MGWCVALLLASAADPLFSEVTHADAVAVGTVTAVGPAAAANWRVAEVRVEATWLGSPRPAVERVVAHDVLQNLHPPWSWRPLFAPGQRCILLLSGCGAGLQKVINLSMPVPESPAGVQVWRACQVVNDPVAGLTATTPAARYFAAALLAERYAMWRPVAGGGCGDAQRNRFRVGEGVLPPVPVPAEQTRLILRAIAEQSDWTSPRPGLPRPVDLVARSNDRGPDDGLGLSGHDGWTWPESAGTPDYLARALLPDWLADSVRLPTGPLPPLPQLPVPSDQRVEFIREVCDRFGLPTDFDRIADADRAGLARRAFDRWLDGPGGRGRLWTTAGALRPPAAGGGWNDPPRAGTMPGEVRR